YNQTVGSSGIPLLRHGRPMMRHLRPLTGTMTGPRYLRIATVGQDDYLDHKYLAKLDEDRYREWAEFIDSHRNAIETLVFEHGLEPEERDTNFPHNRSGRIGRKQFGRPRDSIFMKHLLPILLNGPGPKLRKLDIREV
ncbi:hypothetical protein B0J14DRAFT_428689, partial [Halenospora varia]